MGHALACAGGHPVRTQPYPSWPQWDERERQLLNDVLESGTWGGRHDVVAQFEEQFAEFHQCAFGISVANGTLALELALRAGDVGEGDEVIVPAHSFIATAAAVSRVGAIPVFVDISPETFNIDPEQIKRALSPRTKAIVVVHFGGMFADMGEILPLAEQHGIRVFEDAAHAHGARWRGRSAGSVGLASSFSFQNSKAMTAGEGGILLTNDEAVAALARSLADCGRRTGQDWFAHYELGSNFRLGAFQAAVLLPQLERLPQQVELRNRNYRALSQWTPPAGIRLQAQRPDDIINSFYLLPGSIDEDALGVSRDGFVEALNAEGVPCRPFYPHPLYHNPLFEHVEHRVLPCPTAEQASSSAFWLPLRSLMGSEEDTRDICRAIDKIGRLVGDLTPQL